MAIQVPCPGCHAVLKTADSSAGKRAKCPKCGTIVQIPELAKPEPEEEILEPELSDGMLGFSDEEYELEEQQQPPSPTEDRKPCPMCGELIAAKAVKCRHCGEIFDPVLKKQAKKQKSHSSEDEDLSVGEWVLAILCSNIACIFAIIWMIQGKPKGTKMLIAALAAQGFWFVIGMVAQSLNP